MKEPRIYPTQVSRVDLDQGSLIVLRDDLLPGGTKQRACVPFLEDRIAGGDRRFVYASPFAGFAQVALALACRELGVECRIFAEEDKTALLPGCPHPFTAIAANAGAEVKIVKTLNVAEEQAQQYARESASNHIPLGFAHEAFRERFRTVLARCWEEILAKTRAPIRRVWVPVGSGTIASCLRAVLPDEIELLLVNVKVLGDQDPRIQKLLSLPIVCYHSTEEEFHQPARILPPLPSNTHYDAKLRRLIRMNALANDLWWNVAR